MTRQVIQSSSEPVLLPQLAACSTFRSRDRDEVKAHVGRMFCDHTLQLVNRHAELATSTRRLDCNSLTFTEMTYGADVLVNPGRLEQFYLVQVPVAGSAWTAIDGQKHFYAPGKASVQDPDKHVQMYWSADCRKLVVRYERTMLERFVELYLGQSAKRALRLSPTVALDQPAGAAFLALLNSLTHLPLQQDDDFSPLLKSHFEFSFKSALMLLQPQDGSAGLWRHDQREPPRTVRLIVDYLQAHAHEAIALEDLALMAGVPMRTLHHQFRHSLGVSPMQLLRDIRLDRVRSELLRGAPEASVTRIALHWGFEHLGRFAASYRERFGETPRDTLQRVRRM